ncbi:MAG TPA: hypothetical protein VG167_23240 [Verrucomicrobiae bacterium]|nr:hypothetical protein [Verrucomicrobiae bacterium]
MKSTIAEARKVTVCAHCAGTGTCQRGSYQTDHHHHWLECQYCGKGVPAVVGDDLETEEHRPRCSVCDGRGYLGL